MEVPDFVVAGAARCGTTALHDALAAHPGVRMSQIKEPNHFLFRPGRSGPEPLIGPDRAMLAKSVPDRAGYERLFAGPPGAVTGDVSPLYLYTRETPALLAAARPDVRVVAVLRDPAERAFSHFLYTYTGDPAEAVDRFRSVVEREWSAPYEPFTRGTHVLRLGRYAEQLRRWEAVVPRERLLLLDFPAVSADFVGALRRILDFVGVPCGGFTPVDGRLNGGGVPATAPARAVERTLRAVQPYVKRALPPRLVAPLTRVREWQRSKLATAKPWLPEDLRRRLLDGYYRDDLAELRERWGLDLVAERRAPQPVG